MAAIAPRTCTEILLEGQQTRKGASRLLQDFRDVRTYVLLGDPGAGKTTAFESERDALGDRACLVTARDFLALEPDNHPEWHREILFIDGLDEVRAGKSNVVASFDKIRNRLDRLHPRYLRLSCRAADWLGPNDQKHLEKVVAGGKVTVLSLDKLSDSSVEKMLEPSESASISTSRFIEKAKQRGVEELLRNPLTLKLLVETIAPDGDWPASRLEVFEQACQQMVRECNEEHLLAASGQDIPGLLDAAGRLCAVQLISELSGFARHASQATADCPAVSQCSGNVQQMKQAVKTRLFTVDENRIFPVHRHIAEFLAARHLSRIVSDGLPVRRVLSLMTGGDGFVVTPLRGLAAWLAAHNAKTRTDLIKLDPVGTGQYGDLSAFSNEDLGALLESLRFKSHVRALPRSGIAFGALATPRMEPEIERLLAASSRADHDQAFTAFILSFLPHGQALPGLCETLHEIIRDPTRWPGVRRLALDAFIHCAGPGKPTDKLITLLADIRRGTVSDPDFELLGTLLAELYPENLSFPKVFDYLTPVGNSFLIGRYTRFWETHLRDKTPDHQIPGLLDSLAGKFDELRPALETHHLWNLPTNLLTRALEAHGDPLDAKRLYDWLGMDLPTGPRDPGQYDFIRSWLEQRPDLQKALVREGLKRHPDSGSFEIHRALGQRFHGARVPSDFGIWCLNEALSATAPGSPAERYLLGQAVEAQQTGMGDAGLSLKILQEHAEINETLKRMLTPPSSAQTPLPSGQETPDQAEDELLAQVRANETELRENRASPYLLFHLAQVYLDRFPSEEERNPHAIQERLQDDVRLTASVLQGLRQVVDRKDVPNAERMLGLREEGKISLFSLPFLAALAEIEKTESENPSQWNEDRIHKALLFYYTTPHGCYQPRWYEDLLETRPEAVADMQIRFAIPEMRRGQEHIYKLWELAHRENHAQVAKRACLPLLRAFPTRCRKEQLNLLGDLLWAAIQHTEDGSFLNLVKKKTTLVSTTIGQRVYWLAAGSVMAPEEYSRPLQDFVCDKPGRARHLAEFLHRDDPLVMDSKRWSTPVSELVVGLVGRYIAPGLRFTGEGGLVTAQMETSDLVHRHIRSLADSPDRSASETLGKLLDDPALLAWRDILRQASEEQQVILRDAEYLPPSIDQICQTLDGSLPANASDLWALLTDRLDEIGVKICCGSTNGWRQYWNEDSHGKPKSPKRETSCRDAVLDSLTHHLPQGVDLQPEGHYAHDTRADIRAFYQGFNVPIEIKKNSHSELWRAMTTQLIPKYTVDPSTDGYGIYLVLWFGKDEMPPSPSGPRPTDPESLKQQLTTLSENETRKISVCVIDVSRKGAHAPESDALHGVLKGEEESRVIK